MNEEEPTFHTLKAYLHEVPAIVQPVGHGRESDGKWCVKFTIDINHRLTWHVVQELGHVVNYLSIDERLPTSFFPVFPPPYMNGGPRDFLSWVIECRDAAFQPGTLAQWLEGRLPRPVSDQSQWHPEE